MMDKGIELYQGDKLKIWIDMSTCLQGGSRALAMIFTYSLILALSLWFQLKTIILWFIGFNIGFFIIGMIGYLIGYNKLRKFTE